MKIPESLKNVLSEADLADIKKEFDKQVQIQVESALHQYDSLQPHAALVQKYHKPS